MKNNIQDILKIIISVFIIGAIIILGTKLLIFLLPVIIVGLILYYIYINFLKGKFYKNKKQTKSNKTTKNIKNKIEEAEIIEERFDK